jgi:tetratricopeptide (TPR) repeat protein
MELSGELRAELWRSQSWEKRIGELESDTKRWPDPWARGRRFFELGRLAEEIVPDRERALGLYQRAWKAAGDHGEALRRARALYDELGSLEMVARLAEIEHKQEPSPTCLAVAGEAWLDAGEPGFAVRPLLAALRADADNERIRDALAVAQMSAESADGELKNARQTATSAPPQAAARAWLLCARILFRFARKNWDAREHALRLALASDPRDHRAARLLAGLLGETNRFTELGALFRQIADDAATIEKRIAACRQGGLVLATRFGQRDAAADLLTQALSTAYNHDLVPIPGHLAMLAALRDCVGRDRFAEVARLCERALELERPADERLLLNLFAATLAWRSMRDYAAANRYFDRVEALVPDHPLVAEFEATAGEEVQDNLRAAETLTRREAEAEAALEAEAEREREEEIARARYERRRAFDRIRLAEVVTIEVAAPVEVIGAGAPFPAATRDVSEAGVFVRTDRAVAKGSRLRLTLRMPGEADWTDQELAVDAIVVRHEPGTGFAAELVEPGAAFLAIIARLRQKA